MNDEEANPNGHFPEEPTTPNKRSRGSGSEGKRQGRRKGNAKLHANGMAIDDQVCIFLLCRAIVVYDNFTGASG